MEVQGSGATEVDRAAAVRYNKTHPIEVQTSQGYNVGGGCGDIEEAGIAASNSGIATDRCLAVDRDRLVDAHRLVVTGIDASDLAPREGLGKGSGERCA